MSALGWPEQRVIGHLIKWYGAPQGVGTASAFAAMSERQAKNAVDDVESRVEVANKIMRGRELDDGFYAKADDPWKLVNSLSDPNDVMELWIEVSGALTELTNKTLR